MLSSATKNDVNNLKNSAQNVRDDFRDAANDVKADANVTANQLGKKIRGFFDSASSEICEASDNVSTQIHNKPVQSSLIALGVGFVLGALLSR